MIMSNKQAHVNSRRQIEQLDCNYKGNAVAGRVDKSKQVNMDEKIVSKKKSDLKK